MSRSSIVFGARVHCFVVWCIVFSANQRRPCKNCNIAPQKRVLKRNEFVGYRKEKRKTKRNAKKKKTVKHVRVSESSETSHDVSWPAWPG